MNALFIDIGNTNLKWGRDTGDGFVFGGACRSQPEAIESLFNHEWDTLKPETVLISCVSNEAIKRQVSELSRSCLGVQAEVLVTPKQDCGITNAYTQTAELGSDRWAGMVAAFAQECGPVCVVSCGTAVTLDVVNAEGLHQGGLILPGFGLMQTCLRNGTSMSFLDEPISSTQAELGRSTQDCIRQGSIQAISGVVNTVFHKIQNESAETGLILTGGDAEILQGQLGSDCIINPYLVLKGLSIIHRSRITVSST